MTLFASDQYRSDQEDVVDRLQLLADHDGTSLSAFAVRELSAASRRALNPSLVGKLPDLGVEPASIMDSLGEGRAQR